MNELSKPLNALQLDIFHQELMLMRTRQEVIDLAQGGLTLSPDDPRDAVLEQLDRMYEAAEEER